MTRRLADLSAAALSKSVVRGEASPREVVDDCLSRIDELEPTLQAWTHVDGDRARSHADALSRRLSAGEEVGVLAGVPVGIKDIFNTADMPTQMGSPIWSGFTPGNDARVVASLRNRGALVLGKTATAEFAVHAPGPTGNPHNPAYMTGTSSAGSAVAVAAMMVPLALGTQTAGSIVRPASYCGVYGFKPSFGLIPRTGMLKTTDSLDTVGFMARTIEDLEIMLEVCRVHGRDYPISHRALDEEARRHVAGTPWRIAVVRGPKWDAAEAYARDALLMLAKELGREPDVIVEEVELPAPFDRAHDVHATIYDRSLAYYFKEEFRQHTLISPVMYEIIARGNEIGVEQFTSALRAQSDLAATFKGLMESHDAVLTLSTGGAALEGLSSPDRDDTCLIWTMCGAPAVSCPVFMAPDGMPFGAQWVGRRYGDLALMTLLRTLRSKGILVDAPNPHPRLDQLVTGSPQG